MQNQPERMIPLAADQVQKMFPFKIMSIIFCDLIPIPFPCRLIDWLAQGCQLSQVIVSSHQESGNGGGGGGGCVLVAVVLLLRTAIPPSQSILGLDTDFHPNTTAHYYPSSATCKWEGVGLYYGDTTLYVVNSFHASPKHSLIAT